MDPRYGVGSIPESLANELDDIDSTSPKPNFARRFMDKIGDFFSKNEKIKRPEFASGSTNPNNSAIALQPSVSARRQEVKEHKGSNHEKRPKIYLNIFKRLSILIAQVEQQLRDQYKTMLTDDVFMFSITHGKIDRTKCYEVDAYEKDDPVYYYLNLLNLLINAQYLMNYAGELNEIFLKFIQKEGYLDKGKLIVELRHQIFQGIDETGIAYIGLLEALHALKIDAMLAELPAAKDLKRLAALLLPKKKIEKQVAKNPLVLSYKNKRQEWRKALNLPEATAEPKLTDLADKDGREKLKKEFANILKAFPTKVETIQQALEGILSDLSGNKLPRTVQNSIKNSLRAINGLQKAIEKFTKTQQQLPDLIALIYKLIPLGNSLVTHLPQSYVSLKNVFKDQFLITAQQLNLTFQDLFLHFDKLEIHYYLREGYLSSLGEDNAATHGNSLKTVAEGFNNWIERLGYQFKKDERFPYANSIAEQRVHLLRNYKQQEQTEMREQKHETNTSIPHKKNISWRPAILNTREHTGKKAVRELNSHLDDEQQTLEKTYFLQKAKAIDALINQRVDTLTKEHNRWYTHWWSSLTQTKEIKMKLLEKLRTLLKRPDTTFADALNKMRRDGIDYTPLTEGRTGKLFKQLRYLTTTREQGLETIDYEIKILETKHRELERNHNGCFSFFSDYRKTQLSNRIIALLELKSWLEKSGYRLDEALEMINAKHPQTYNLLISNENWVLDTIRKIDETQPTHVIGRKDLDYFPAEIRVPGPATP